MRIRRIHYEVEKQCGNCLHLFDESILTVCMLHDWKNVEYNETCDDFKGLDHAT